MNKVEEVARALAAHSWEMGGNDHSLEAFTDRRWPHYVIQATAAITAMRIPTPQMVNAGTESLHGYGVEYRTVEAYQAMIDAALGEQE